VGDIFCYAESSDAVVLPIDAEREDVSRQAGKEAVQKLSNDHFTHRNCCPLQSQVSESWKFRQGMEANQVSHLRPLGM